MTKLEILELVANSYNYKNRAIGVVDECRYITDDGRMCAVGMCMTEDAIKQYGDCLGNVHELNGSEELDELLKTEFQGHSVEFWADLQILHDTEIYWNEKGLSDLGRAKYETLKLQYNQEVEQPFLEKALS